LTAPLLRVDGSLGPTAAAEEQVSQAPVARGSWRSQEQSTRWAQLSATATGMSVGAVAGFGRPADQIIGALDWCSPVPRGCSDGDIVVARGLAQVATS
jgi:hypothetical protein